MATEEPIWTYWCPAEGDHRIHPQELQVGIVAVDDDGCGRPLMVAAVIPPAPRLIGPETTWHQMEAFARVTRDAFIAASEAEGWTGPDGLAAGLWADGFPVPFPKTLPPLVTVDPDA